MIRKIFISIIIITVIAGFVILCSAGKKKITDNSSKNEAKSLSSKQSSLALNYKKIETGKINYSKKTQYSLPLEKNKIDNYDNVVENYNLTVKEKELFYKNGFVTFDNGESVDINDLYNNGETTLIPNFITSDSLLHIYHIQFDNLLKNIEEKEFYKSLSDLTESMINDLITRIGKNEKKAKVYGGDISKAYTRNIAYFSVAMKLLKPEYKLSDYGKDLVEKELKLIEKHSGIEDSPIFKYGEDYSQYVPRGHYTKSETLKKYFKAMMWYGRIIFLLPSKSNAENGIAQTYQAALIVQNMKSLKVGDKTALEIWDRIYNVIAFFVGLSDDLGIYEYDKVLKKVLKSAKDITDIFSEKEMNNFKKEMSKEASPKIYGGQITEDTKIKNPSEQTIEEVLNAVKGFKFMGQKYIPDSYMFQQLCFPAVSDYLGKSDNLPFTYSTSDLGPIRGYVRGLDIFSVLDSDVAKTILKDEGDTEFKNYDTQISKLSKEFSNLSEKEWHQNLYFNWLYVLKSLIDKPNKDLPTFATTEAWQIKNLNSALSSWAELRHDTILYAKQSYTAVAEMAMPDDDPPPTPTLPKGYVEPNPWFFARLLELTNITIDGLESLKALPEDNKYKLLSLKTTLEKLLELSKKEINSEDLTNDDYQYIKDFNLNNIYPAEIIDSIENNNDSEKLIGHETVMIADVHSNPNESNCVEEGVGFVRGIIVAYKLPDGKINSGIGPVLSYREFKQPMSDRLTDEKWYKMLKEDNKIGLPKWISKIGKNN